MKTKFKNILFGIAFILSALIFAEEVNKKVYVVSIQDVIVLGILELVSRAIDLAVANNAELIVFDIFPCERNMILLLLLIMVFHLHLYNHLILQKRMP